MAAMEHEVLTGGPCDRHVLEANTGKGVEDAETNGSSSRHACRATSTRTEVEQACEGEHIFRKLVCRTGGIQGHHIHERCMGLGQEWHWKCCRIVDHEGDGERREKVHGFFGEFHVPAAQMPSNPQDHSPIVSQMLEEFPASFLMK
jgi:hypothetical protein